MTLSSLAKDQILGLAPDNFVVKTAKPLAAPFSWNSLFIYKDILRGEFPNGARPPYQVTVSLNDIAFGCECSSRKMPCKHAMGLLLLYNQRPELFTNQENTPKSIEKWRTIQTKASQQLRQTFTTADQTRLSNIQLGMQDLALWLRDLMRNGLAELPSKPRTFWSQMTARLIDAQAIQTAHDIQSLSNIAGKRPNWPDEMLRVLGRVYLLTQAFERYDQLPTELQTDLKLAVGWISQPVLPEAGGELVRQPWQVAGRSIEMIGKRAILRTWLWGQETQRPALFIQVLRAQQAGHFFWATGSVHDATFSYHPSSWPLHVQLVERHKRLDQPATVAGASLLASSLLQYRQTLTSNPWLRQFPLDLKDVYPVHTEDGWFLRDQANIQIPIMPDISYGWHFAAISGGRPISIFGEWDGQYFKPLSLYVNDHWRDMHVWGGVK